MLITVSPIFLLFNAYPHVSLDSLAIVPFVIYIYC